MKAAVYYNNDDIRIEERPVPELSEGEILVKMMASGICGTDVMQWYRIKKAPRILGHEMAGEIVAIGKEVQSLPAGPLRREASRQGSDAGVWQKNKNVLTHPSSLIPHPFTVGDRVFVSHHVPCYKCPRCLKGNFNACESLHSGNYDPGGFSEFIRIPEQNVKYGTLLLPKQVSYEEAAMIEPLACAIAGQNRAGIKENHCVLVIGSGVSGLLHIQLAKMKNAKVVATDINEFKLKKALEFGADYAIDAREYSLDELKKINRGMPADTVIVCAASRDAIKQAMDSVDRKGTLLFFAVPEDDMALPSQRFWRDEITVTFSYGASPEDLKEALNLIEPGRINARDMITHKIPLSGIRQGFKIASESKESLKVVIVPDNPV